MDALLALQEKENIKTNTNLSFEVTSDSSRDKSKERKGVSFERLGSITNDSLFHMTVVAGKPSRKNTVNYQQVALNKCETQ